MQRDKQMDFSGKRLLILGGAPQSSKIVKCAKELGIYTIVADINENAPAKRGADESLNMSLFDHEGLLAWCKAHPVDGVINICVDFAQKTQLFLCEHLGLPCFGSAEQVNTLTDKQTFKKTCMKYGMDVIPEYTEEDALSGKVSLPLFVKPAEGSGSRGAYTCQTMDELKEAIDAAKKDSRNGKVIIEKFLGGHDDFQVTYIFIDGKPYLQRTADRHHGAVADHMENVSALAISPSKYMDLYLRKYHENAQRMLMDLGLKTAPVFFQGFVDGDAIRFYDPAIRLTGANFENILKAATGLDTVKMFVEYAMSGKAGSIDLDHLSKAYLLDGKFAALAFPMSRGGRIEKVCGLDEIEKMPEVVSATYRRREGDSVKETGDVTQRFGEFDVVANSKDELKATLKAIQDKLVLLDADGQDMVISKPDLENI